MLKVFRPRGFLYPGDVMVDSGIHARYDVAAKSSETGDSDHIVHAVVVLVKNGEWSSAVTLEQQQVYSINLPLLVNVFIIKMI